MIAPKRVIVTDAATLLMAEDEGTGASVKNLDATDKVQLGKADVTAANGDPLDPGERLILALAGNDALYGRCAAGLSAEVAVWPFS